MSLRPRVGVESGCMRTWTPQSLYDAKPWVSVAIGVILALGSMGWSLSAGVWSVWRSLLCFAGVALTIIGGITLQLRHDYRARSKWRRASRP
jgi:protein-S-isoprenylcysteine O-methyltransferase Ste14